MFDLLDVIVDDRLDVLALGQPGNLRQMVVEKEKIYRRSYLGAHKAFLCSRSAVFSAMLQGDMLEARESEITVTDVDPATFAALLHYAYTGELKEGQDLNNMIYGQGKIIADVADPAAFAPEDKR